MARIASFVLSLLVVTSLQAHARSHHHYDYNYDDNGSSYANNTYQSAPNPYASTSAPSDLDLPTCPDTDGRPMDLNNDQVLQWKKSTRSGYLDRGFIRGTLVGVYPAKPGHLHLDVFLGQTPSGKGHDSDIEVIYNTEFGETQGELTPGMDVVACGDYITSSEQNGRYPPSPDDAILHWVHKSNSPKHVSGYLMIDGKLYGQKDAPPFGHGRGNKYDGGGDNNNGDDQSSN